MAEEFDEAYYRATTIACDGQPIGDREFAAFRDVYRKDDPNGIGYLNTPSAHWNFCVCGKCQSSTIDIAPPLEGIL